MKISEEVENLEQELIELRRDFHQHPELGFAEERTGQIVEDYLKACGIPVKRLAKTGVVGLIRGSKPGKTILLRADMDALPIQEENDVPYKSKYEGKMHACGHDGHVAMLLVAAKILAKHRDEIKGNIKLVFQPNEEEAGAEVMITEGVLEDPPVDAAVGLHLWSPIESGKIGITPGPLMASSYYFKLTIQGKGGHGGAPHEAVDPVLCAANIIQSAQKIQTRETSALQPTVITFCKVNCGTSPIIIPDKVVLEGSIRCLHKGAQEINQSFEQVVSAICTLHNTSYELELQCGNNLLNNDEAMTQLVEEVAGEVLGGKENIENDVSVMLGEDFAEFARQVPAAFYFLGAKNEAKGSHYPHHNSHFNIDEDVLTLGVKMHILTALRYLQKNS